MWNSLAEEVVTAESVKCFKGSFDRWNIGIKFKQLGDEEEDLTRTCCSRFDRWDWNHCCIDPTIWWEESSRYRRIPWSTASKAADIQQNKSADKSPALTARRMSVKTWAQRSPLSGKLGTPTGILVADRLSWNGQGAGKQQVFQVASKGLIDWR